MEGVLGTTPCHHDVKTPWDVDRSCCTVNAIRLCYLGEGVAGCVAVVKLLGHI
jgi:hypothetical protein